MKSEIRIPEIREKPEFRIPNCAASVAQAFQPADSGDFPVASLKSCKHGTGKSREPADRNVCATSSRANSPIRHSGFGFLSDFGFRTSELELT